jgi:hypothetical protein
VSIPTTFAFLLITLLSFGTAVAKPRPSPARPQHSARQGICGTVTELRGNQMPSPDQPKPITGGRPVVRQVLIFKVLTMKQVTSDDAGFITEINGAKPVKTLKTNKQGKYCVYGLPVGTYSVLVREPQGLYYNISDIDNRMNPVTVKKGKITTATVEISHGASF